MTPARPSMVPAISLDIVRDELTRKIRALEQRLAAERRHADKAVGDLATAASQTAAAAERRRIAEQLRAEARGRSRKLAGPLRIVANMIEETS